MNVDTMTMPKAEARRQLQVYRKAIHRKADAEYEAVAAAYEQMGKGLRLLNLREAFAQVPLDAQGRPRLAIARADDRQVKFSDMGWPRRTHWAFDSRPNSGGRRAWMTRLEIPRPVVDSTDAVEGYALVPMVPPAVKQHHALAKLHVLWEVEQWADQRIRAEADRDPYLLRFVGGDLWAVLGEWDLTEVERAVMAGRAAP